ncbi:FeoA family protein [Maricaulis sp.]|uniref:FeoA family protein n=1 Tax=Maricaulis sp. TaxID=1486257 RepID=UPI003A8CF060
MQTQAAATGPDVTLDQLEKGQICHVTGFVPDCEDLVIKLREIGFAESDEVELMHRGPLGANPLCFRLNRTLIALRSDEARAIEVEASQ